MTVDVVTDDEVIADAPELEFTERLMLVTVEQAQRWLVYRRENRTLSREHVSRLVDAMEAGNWSVAAADVGAIILDVNGLLVDGQHRCAAIVRVEKPQWMRVRRNIKDEPLDDIRIRSSDVRAQTHRNVLESLRVPQPKERHAIGRTWLSLETGLSLGASVPSARVVEWARKEPDLFDEAIRLTASCPGGLGYSHLGAIYMWSATSGWKDARKVLTRFCERYMTGLELSLGDPEYALRTRLLSGPRHFLAVRDREAMLGRIVTAMWARISNEKMHKSTISRVAFERFAKLIGKPCPSWAPTG